MQLATPNKKYIQDRHDPICVTVTKMTDRPYQVRMAVIQSATALLCFVAAIACYCYPPGPWLGLLLSGVANVLLSYEKIKLLQRNPTG